MCTILNDSFDLQLIECVLYFFQAHTIDASFAISRSIIDYRL